MVSEAPIFSPDIEELLREIAGQPGSVLLRTQREKVPASLLETRSPIGPMTAGLSSAERELVRVHREEFAFQLRQACWVKLATGKEGRIFLNRHLGNRTEIATPDPITVRASLEHAFSTRGSFVPSLTAANTWTEEPDFWRTSVTNLAATAHRIVPAHQDWIYASLDNAFQGLLHTAVGLLWAGLSGRTDLSGSVHAYVAFCQDQAGELDASCMTWRLAVQEEPDRTDFLPSFLLMALRTGNDEQVLFADQACAQYLNATDPLLTNFSTRMKARRHLGAWCSQSRLAMSLHRWQTRLSDAGAQIARSIS